MKKILVIGSNNYLGMHLVEYLNNMFSDTVQGCHILEQTVIETMGVNTVPDFLDRYQHWYRDLKTKPDLPYDYDIVIYNENIESINFDRSTKILHGKDYSAQLIKDLVDVNLKLLYEALDTIEYKHFIYIADHSSYDPNSYYALTLKIAEETVAHFCKNKKKDFTIFRAFDLIGYKNFFPGFIENLDNINRKFEKALIHNKYTFQEKSSFSKDGTIARDYVHVLEACEAIYQSCLNPTRRIENLCYNEFTTEKELLDFFVEVNDLPYPELEYRFAYKQVKNNLYYETSALLKRKYTKYDWVRIREDYNIKKALNIGKLKELL